MSDNYRVLRALRLYLVLDPGLCGGSEGLVYDSNWCGE